MSVAGDSRIHLSPFVGGKRDGWDGAWGAYKSLTGDASGGVVQPSFYFGKATLEANEIVMDEIAWQSNDATIGGVVLVTDMYALTEDLLGVRSLWAFTTAVLGTITLPYMTFKLPKPHHLSQGLPIRPDDPYSFFTQFYNNVDTKIYETWAWGRYKNVRPGASP